MFLASIGFALVLISSFIGIPICFSMFVIAIVMFAVMRGIDPAIFMAGQTIYGLATNVSFAVLPMFIFMAVIIYKSNFAEDLYELAYAYIGHKRGGLAYATILASAAFASMSGSSIATAATMSRVAIPPMLKREYSDSFAGGCVASAGTLGCLLPPSIPLLIYGIIAQQDIGKLFIAGVLPGILLASLFMISVWLMVRLNPQKGPAGTAASWAERLNKTRKVGALVVLLVVIIGGLYSGFFTANEAGAIGAAGAIILSLVRRRLTRKILISALVEAGEITATIFAVAFGGLMFANFIAMTGLTDSLSNFLLNAHLPVIGILLIVVLLYVILGSVMEAISMMFLTVPVLASVLSPLGVNMLWFGVFVVMMIEIGMIHPPMGMNVYVVNNSMPSMKIGRLFWGAAPFLIASLITLAVLLIVPGIATWLTPYVK